MTTKNKPNKANSLARDKRVQAALAKHFTGSATLTLDGTSYKAKELQELLSDRQDAVAAADAVKATWQTAVAKAKEKNDEAATMLIALRQHILSQYGAASQAAADFGFSTKRKQATVETKAAALVKREATRAAGGSKAKRQASLVGGEVSPANQATQTQPGASSEPKPTA